ncbi:hypothetical protein BGX34_006465 [Mortierella sp. NVP85]|nr:hypothetical protein BGX34_006465 [Mortierella sp. NVP85]
MDEDEYYHDDDEGGEYDEQDQDDSEGEEGGDIKIGEEIELTHEEIWDDSPLVKAWDAIVKQYEVYHSKTKGAEATIPSESTKRKGRAEQVASEQSSSSKRTKLTNGRNITKDGGLLSPPASVAGATVAAESDTPTNTQVSSQSSQGQASTSSSDPAATERKPSFRKADKPSFHHLRQSQAAEDTSTRARDDLASSRTRPASKPQRGRAGVSADNATVPAAAPQLSTHHPSVDAATIAYYQSLGYYYDPSYDTTTRASETGGGGGEQDEQQGLQDESVRDNCSSRAHNATTSKSNANTKNRPLATGASTAVPQTTFFGNGPQTLPYPQGYYGGYPSQGGLGMPGAPMIPPGWGGVGAGAMPMPFTHGPIPAAGGGNYPPGMMPHLPLPPTAAATTPGHPPLPGQFSASGMDDEALGNLIMAWYFSGYYTGLYRAQRR